MHSNIQKLYEIAGKSKRMIIGLMSGTSLDGLDIALCAIEGSGQDTKVELMHFDTIPYSEELKNEIRPVFSKKLVDLERLCLLNPWIALQHAAMINSCLKKWNISSSGIDLVASHGQTIYHAPKRLHQQERYGNATLQIGDGDHLAVATGIITISDFRQKNIAAGAEGAPLAVYGDRLLFERKGEDRILLNIGGIANFTYLPGIDEKENILCTDVGPGNTLMDAYTLEHFSGSSFDKDAELASAGKINDALLAALKDDDFFKQKFPKTTGPELFNLQYLQLAKQKSDSLLISIEDTLATLNKFTADMIVAAIYDCIKNKSGIKIFVSGGGMHNPLLMQHLKEGLSRCSFHSTAENGIDPDAKEAVLFALLANECVSGSFSSPEINSAGIPLIAMGKISFPV
ncbi:MAG TPA: anhydro-N-acetylmuramic acid kinase [Ferruginibacter sp.]|jgi:anhydro-N-acetylmuramic acid kinase|nr:anhydro-N-acetylmuramic acid kinase [Ferruginibacter sp.]